MIKKPMLAVTAEIHKMVYPMLGSRKIDGIRCLITLDNKILSRTFHSIPSIEFNNIASQFFGSIYNLDGEIVVVDETDTIIPYNDIQHFVMASNNPLPSNYKYVFMCFDVINDASKPYIDRVKDLENLSINHDNFKKVIPVEVNNIDDTNNVFELFLSEGYEGAIFRSPNSPYKFGRSTVKENYMLKMKPFEDFEAEITGTFELMLNTNEKTQDAFGRSKRSSAIEGLVPGNTLGGFYCRDLLTGKEFKIGGGKPFTKLYRKQLWDIRETLPGKIIVYTTMTFGVKDKPRISTFKGFRDRIDF